MFIPKSIEIILVFSIVVPSTLTFASTLRERNSSTLIKPRNVKERGFLSPEEKIAKTEELENAATRPPLLPAKLIHDLRTSKGQAASIGPADEPTAYFRILDSLRHPLNQNPDYAKPMISKSTIRASYYFSLPSLSDLPGLTNDIYRTHFSINGSRIAVFLHDGEPELVIATINKGKIENSNSKILLGRRHCSVTLVNLLTPELGLIGYHCANNLTDSPPGTSGRMNADLMLFKILPDQQIDLISLNLWLKDTGAPISIATMSESGTSFWLAFNSGVVKKFNIDLTLVYPKLRGHPPSPTIPNNLDTTQRLLSPFNLASPASISETSTTTANIITPMQGRRLFFEDVHEFNSPFIELKEDSFACEPENRIVTISLNLSKRFLAIGTNGHGVIIYDLIQKKFTKTFNTRENSAAKALDFHSQINNLLAYGGGIKDRTIYLVDVETGKEQFSQEVPYQVTQVKWTPSGNELVAAFGYRDPDPDFKSEPVGSVAWVWRYMGLGRRIEPLVYIKRILGNELDDPGARILNLELKEQGGKNYIFLTTSPAGILSTSTFECNYGKSVIPSSSLMSNPFNSISLFR